MDDFWSDAIGGDFERPIQHRHQSQHGTDQEVAFDLMVMVNDLLVDHESNANTLLLCAGPRPRFDVVKRLLDVYIEVSFVLVI